MNGSNLLRDNPALLRDDWLPPGTGWRDLEKLREEHVRLLRQKETAAEAARSIKLRIEAEDEQHAEALRSAFREGSSLENIPERVHGEEREAELRCARDRVTAAYEAFEEFVESAVALIREQSPVWLRDLEAQEAKAEEKREEARRLVAAADVAVGEIHRMRSWLGRNSDTRLGRLIHFSALTAPPPSREPDLANILGVLSGV
jgi:hypothetical protein